jgi:hypothetical protein
MSQSAALKKDDVLKEKRKLEEEKVRLRNDINIKVSENQVYRIAQFFFAHENAADVSKSELRLTGLIWFGSLAMIVAATGTVLAIAGTLLKHGAAHRGGQRGFFYTARRALVELRRRFRKPKIIEKNIVVEKEKIISVPIEIPVDKVVFRDVPREVVRKELIYVPLYTNDPSLLSGKFGEASEIQNAKSKSAKIDQS